MQQIDFEIKKFDFCDNEYEKNNRSIQFSLLADYLILQQIGNGSFGSVFKGIDRRNNKEVAIKVIDMKNIKNNPNKSTRNKLLRYADSEPEMMILCNSPNILKCYDVFENESLKIFVLEYCAGGTLKNQIQIHSRIEEDLVAIIIKQIINGIAEMHRHGIIHRDLKSTNILEHRGIYKIADFGMTKTLQIDAQQEASFVGTPSTMAPEVANNQKYGLKADIWSLGVVSFEMIFGKVPFNKESFISSQNIEECLNILEKQRITYNGYTASLQGSKFLREMLNMNTRKRIGWKQLSSHSFLKNINKNSNLLTKFRFSQVTNILDLKANQRTDYSPQFKTKIIATRRSIEQTYKLQWINNRDNIIIEEDQESRQFQRWLKQSIFQSLKAELIFNEVIIPLQKYSLLNEKQRKHCEFLFFLLTRCLNTLTHIKIEAKNLNKNLAINYFFQPIAEFQTKIKTQWKKYDMILRNYQNEVGAIISDRFKKIFKNQLFERKQKFLIGLQNQDYKKEEQVAYTYKKYISKFLKENKQSSNQNIKRVIKVLQKYLAIWNPKIQDWNKFKCPCLFLTQLINNQEKKSSFSTSLSQ